MRSINSLIRDNVKRLKPYSSARDEFADTADVYLDANENPFENGVNRYPDPYQRVLKTKIGRLKGIANSNILLGNGSDEVLDLIFRAFCNPGMDNCVSLAPSYGMYKVISDLNDVEFREVRLDAEFNPDYDEILKVVDVNTKLLMLCSPNNPTGNDLKVDIVERLLLSLDCLVVIDEAYIDFSDNESWIERLNEFPNLIIVQTLSKAWGMAGLRLGMCYASNQIIQILNAIKPPYNINELTQSYAIEKLEDEPLFNRNLLLIKEEKNRLENSMKSLSCVKKIYPSSANFFLIKFDRSDEVFDYLMNLSIIVRKRSTLPGCKDCLRVTVGLPEENNRLLDALKKFK